MDRVLVEGRFGRMLHTGDMRYSTALGTVLAPVLQRGAALSRLFLDCTFAAPFWRVLPTREVSCDAVVALIAAAPASARVLLDCELLGHEALIHALHMRLRVRVYVDDARRLKLAALPELHDVLTSCEEEARVFVAREGSTLFARLRTRDALVIKPSTQWFGQRGHATLDATPRQDAAGTWVRCLVFVLLHAHVSQLCAARAVLDSLVARGAACICCAYAARNHHADHALCAHCPRCAHALRGTCPVLAAFLTRTHTVTDPGERHSTRHVATEACTRTLAR